jgi:poly-beta-1,6-N-acetyl-D-glucosamine synthase
MTAQLTSPNPGLSSKTGDATRSLEAKRFPTYVLVSPARNEEDFIELTIRSVIQQTVRPLKWIIVSDGSTDRTDDIVRKYCAEHDWIELVRMPERRERHFGGKVTCFNAGYARLKELFFSVSPLNALCYDIIGSLDADLSFNPEYFEFLLGRFAANPKLGLAGTPFSESGETYDFRFSSTDHVSGACQLFRRDCFEAIGGYVPVKGGGIDVIAVVTARMKGWETRTFTEQSCLHHRPMGTANHSAKLVANFKLGRRQYCLGFHPVWQIFRSAYQFTRKPYVLAGGALCAGYFWAMLRRVERPVNAEFVAFQRRDQMKRLRVFLLKSVGFRKAAAAAALTSPVNTAALPAK